MIIELLKRINQFSQTRNLSKSEIAELIGIPSSTFKKWFLEGKNKRTPSPSYVKKLEFFLEVQEAQRRSGKIRFLLLLLEDELGWFRDGSTQTREVFREALDLSDIGYISSLLTMLGDESKFVRWLTLSTNRFQYFKKRQGH